MRVCHEVTAVFDDPNLVSCAGLAPVLQLAERAGLPRLVGQHVHLAKPGGVNAHLKVPGLVAGMVAGADSIQDMDLLRHGAMKRLFGGVRAPSTLGTFLRAFTFGHVRQLDAVASRLLVELAGRAPLLPGADELAYVDVDDTLKQTYGYAKQGAGRGYTGVKGLNALLAVVSTPGCAPVIAAARLRRGGANSARGADRFVSDALITAGKAGATGTLVLRADSAYYSRDVIAATLRQGARFSITARQDKAVRKAISTIAEHTWTHIKYTNAIFDEHSRTTYWLDNAFGIEDITPYLRFGSGLDNQRAVTVRSTFLQNRGYLDRYYREAYTVVEMEAGPYCNAVYEMTDPDRYPEGEQVNFSKLPIDFGIIHYASDTPYTQARTLGARGLSYHGMDSTYASSIAILRRILRQEGALTNDADDNGVQEAR